MYNQKLIKKVLDNNPTVKRLLLRDYEGFAAMQALTSAAEEEIDKIPVSEASDTIKALVALASGSILSDTIEKL